MEIVEKNGPGYQDARRIANARFDYLPQFVCYCEDRADVVEALRFAKRTKLPVRVRSGGHHHEGMCSGNGVVIIDLSRLSRIRFSGGGSSVWIGPGARLQDVYSRVQEKERLFPGGGCGDVRVGGLVQGGGWGTLLTAAGADLRQPDGSPPGDCSRKARRGDG